MLSVEKVETFASLMRLEAEWRKLESHSGLPFATWDWTIAWWNQLREDKLGVKDSLFVRAIRANDGELIAVAPMLISRRPSIGPLCIRQLQFFGADPNITEVRGILARPHQRGEAYRALVRHALDNAEHWDVMHLSGVPADFRADESPPFGGFEWVGETLDYELPLPGSWEELRSGLPRNIKESLRKCYNSLKRDSRAFRLDIAQHPHQVGVALDRFFKFHSERSRLEETVRHSDVFYSPEARRFLTEVCERFARRGCMRIFQLRIDEQVVALRIGFVVGDCLYLYYSGYDPEFARYSVMTTTVAEAIKYAITQGMKVVNLSTGNDISKTRWNPVEIISRQALILSPSKRAGVARGIYRHAVSAIEEVPAFRQATKFLARRSTPLGRANGQVCRSMQDRAVVEPWW
jgi:CelD/BcsL family acetyltransferase involved in cellulose biosynthesis